MDNTKILARNPFKMKNKLEKELEIIQKLVDKTTKKVQASELANALASDFEGLLLKTKDPIQAWVRANALEQLGFVDAALLFKAKATELGYVVENINTNENMENMEDVKTFEVTVKFKIQTTLADDDGIRAYVFDLLDADNIGVELYDMTVIPTQIYDDIETPDVNPAGMSHLDENNDVTKCACGENAECTCPPVVESGQLENMHPDNTTIYNAIIAKYPLSEVLQNNLKRVIDNYDKGVAEKEFNENDFNETINAICAITGAEFSEIEQLIKSETFTENLLVEAIGYLQDTYNDIEEFRKYNEIYGIANKLGFDTVEDCWTANPYYYSSTNPADIKIVEPTTTLETYKQQFMYSPQEETKWKLFEDDATIEKPKFNAMALRHMISDDAFLKFSYHNLSTGIEDNDLELIYNTYIKGDDDMLNKLKTYETYTFKVLENNIAKDNVAQTITDVLKDLNIEDVQSDIITKTSAIVKENINIVKSSFALYTQDIKSELKSVFNEATITSIIGKLNESKISLADDKTVLTEKLAKTFGLTNDGAGYLLNVIDLTLPKITEMSYIGADSATKLFSTGTAITLLSSIGITIVK